MFVGVIVIQLWLYQVSVPAAAAWGLLVPALALHIYFWMAPLIREQGAVRRGTDSGRGRED